MKTLYAAVFSLLMTTAASAGPPGQLDKSMLHTAATAAGTQSIKIYTSPDGSVWKIAVYHKDAGAIPAAVSKLALKKLPGLTIDRYETELYAEGGAVYEVEGKLADGGRAEVSVGKDGALRYVERYFKPAKLPAAVSAAATKAAGKGKIISAEHKKGPKIDVYGVKVELDGSKYTYRFDPSGKLLSRGVRVPAVVEIGLPIN